MVELVKSLKKMLNPEYLVQNSYLFAVLSIFLVIYGPRLHPKLPESLKNLFNNPVFRAIILFLISFLASKNFQSSIVITVIFLVTMNILHTSKVFNNFKNYEKFTNNGPPVSTCSSYNNIKSNGTAFYPLNDNNQEKDL